MHKGTDDLVQWTVIPFLFFDRALRKKDAPISKVQTTVFLRGPTLIRKNRFLFLFEINTIEGKNVCWAKVRERESWRGKEHATGVSSDEMGAALKKTSSSHHLGI